MAGAVRRGALVTLLFQWGGYVLQLLSLIVLARILLPADYGLITMAAALIGVAAVIGDFGLSLAALQARELSQQQKSNLFWLNSAVGMLVGLVVAAAAPVISAFYDEPRLVGVTVALAAVFVLNGIVVQFKVEINRASRFAALGRAELLGQACGLGAAIVLAAGGFGYWALVVQQVAAAAVVLMIAAGSARWRPGLPRDMRSTRPLLSFGRDTLLLQIANYATGNIDSVMVGRFSGAVALGVYNRAYQVTLLPIQQLVAPLTRVFLPRLSAASDTEFPELLRRLQSVISYVTLGPLALLCAASDTIPLLLFGERWRDLTDLIPILAAASFLGVLGYIYYWAFLARAKTMTLFVAELVGRVPMVGLVISLAPLGPTWVALSLVAGQFLVLISSSLFMSRIGVPAGGLLLAAARPCLLFGGALGASLLVRVAAPAGTATVVMALAEIAVFGAVLGVLLLLVRAIRRDVANVIETVRPPRRPA